MNRILYIVVPCYNEQEVLPETSRRLLEKLNDLISQHKIDEQSRILFVDDGSEKMREMSRYRKTKIPSTGTTVTNGKQLTFL